LGFDCEKYENEIECPSPVKFFDDLLESPTKTDNDTICFAKNSPCKLKNPGRKTACEKTILMKTRIRKLDRLVKTEKTTIETLRVHS
jgi:hypothetical protein